MLALAGGHEIMEKIEGRRSSKYLAEGDSDCPKVRERPE
jgi:hypothetical protein